MVATDAVPDGLTYLSSNPPAEIAGRQLQWRLGELGARQQRTIEVSFRAEKPGSVTNCCEVAAAGGLRVSECASTTVTTATLDVRVTGPSQVTVGNPATFEIAVRNLSQSPATGLMIKDRLDQGLEHPAANQNNAIERMLGDLAAGASQRITVTVHVTKPGRLCQTVEVTGPNTTPASAQACVMAVGGSGPTAETSPATPSFTVKMTAPKQVVIGEKALFSIEIRNTGTTTLRNLEVLDRWDSALLPAEATDGYRQPIGGGLAWTIDNLSPGKVAQLGVNCSGETVAAQACNRASVTTPEGAKMEAEACLEVRPPPSRRPKRSRALLPARA